MKEITVARLSLAQYAGVRAGLAEGFALDEMLGAEGVRAEVWGDAEEAWALRLAEDEELLDAFDLEVVAARQRYARRVEPLETEPDAWFALLAHLAAAAEPEELLRAYGLRFADVQRLTALWAERTAADETLLRRALAALVGPPPALAPITFGAPQLAPPLRAPPEQVPAPEDEEAGAEPAAAPVPALFAQLPSEGPAALSLPEAHVVPEPARAPARPAAKLTVAIPVFAPVSRAVPFQTKAPRSTDAESSTPRIAATPFDRRPAPAEAGAAAVRAEGGAPSEPPRPPRSGAAPPSRADLPPVPRPIEVPAVPAAVSTSTPRAAMRRTVLTPMVATPAAALPFARPASDPPRVPGPDPSTAARAGGLPFVAAGSAPGRASPAPNAAPAAWTSLEAHAALHAELAVPGVDRAAVLARHRLTEASKQELDSRWAAYSQRTPEARDAWMRAYAAAVEARRRGGAG